MNFLDPYVPVIGGTVAAGASVAGGLLLTARNRMMDRELLRVILATSVGFLLAAILLEVIPESISAWNPLAGAHAPHRVMALVLAGYLAVIFLERAISPAFHVHLDTSASPGGKEHYGGLIDQDRLPKMLTGLLLHAFLDGVSIASGFLISRQVGWILFIALLLHKIPDGVTIVSVTLAAGGSVRFARIATLVGGVATIAGAIAVCLAPRTVPYVLPFAAGITFHVAASDLVPEVVGKHRDLRTPIALLVGIVLFWLTHSLLDSTLGDHSP